MRQPKQRLAAAGAQDERHDECRYRTDAVRAPIEQREDQLRKQEHEHEIAREEPQRLHALNLQREQRRSGPEREDGQADDAAHPRNRQAWPAKPPNTIPAEHRSGRQNRRTEARSHGADNRGQPEDSNARRNGFSEHRRQRCRGIVAQPRKRRSRPGIAACRHADEQRRYDERHRQHTGEQRVPPRASGRAARQHALKVAVPRNAAANQHRRHVPPRRHGGSRPERSTSDDVRHDAGPVWPCRGVLHPAAGESAGAVERERQRRAQSDRHQRKLKDVSPGDGPHSTQDRVRGRDAGRQQDRRGQVHAKEHAERRPERHQQFGTPEQFAGERRQRQNGRPAPSEPGFERIDQRREFHPAHDAREEQTSHDKAQPETHAALNSQLDRGFVNALGSTKQIAAIDPRRGHRQCGDQERHLPAREHQIGRSALLDTPRCQPADDKEGGVHREYRGNGRHSRLTAEPAGSSD